MFNDWMKKAIHISDGRELMEVTWVVLNAIPTPNKPCYWRCVGGMAVAAGLRLNGWLMRRMNNQRNRTPKRPAFVIFKPLGGSGDTSERGKYRVRAYTPGAAGWRKGCPELERDERGWDRLTRWYRAQPREWTPGLAEWLAIANEHPEFWDTGLQAPALRKGGEESL